MTIGNEQDLQGMRCAGRVVATVLQEMLLRAKPGVTPRELDQFAAQRLRSFGATSAPRSAYDFPGATCISVNDTVAHGVPDDRAFTQGDLVNIDVSAELDGYWADNGASVVVGKASSAQRHLLDHAREARDRAIAAIRPGTGFNQVGRIFGITARRGRYRVIRNLCSHGIGRSLHEEPRELSPVPNRGEQRRFHEGQVLAIEPFMTTGRGWVRVGSDGWSLHEEAGAMSAQFEHTIVVRADGPEILTLPEVAG